MDRDILLMLLSVILGVVLPYLCKIIANFVKSKSNDNLLQTFGLYMTVIDVNGKPIQRYRYCQILIGKFTSYNVIFGDSVETKKFGKVSIKKNSITHRGKGEFSHGSLQIQVNDVNNKLHMNEYFCFKITGTTPYFGLHLSFMSTLDTYCGVAILSKMGSYSSFRAISEHYKNFQDSNVSVIVRDIESYNGSNTIEKNH